MRERTKLEAGIKEVRALFGDLRDTIDLLELADDEEDDDVTAEAEAAMRDLFERAQKAQLKTLLSGEADENDCYLQVQAGAGIVADSRPEAEYQETRNKARGMLKALACLEPAVADAADATP